MKVTRLPVGYLKTNCYLLQDEESAACLLVDPGDEPALIQGALKSFGLRPEYILITHAHFDHIGAAMALCEAYGCPLYCASDEFEASQNDPVYGRAMREFYASFAEAYGRFGRPLSEGDVLCLGKKKLSVLRVPGHSVGSLCFYCASDGLLLGGDTVFPGCLGREDFYVSRGGAPGTLVKGIKEKLMVLPEETRILPGHGEETTVGCEKHTNFYLM